jgi:hypothetical protein
LSRSARLVALIALATFAAAGWRLSYSLTPLLWPTTTGRVTRSAQTYVFVGMYVAVNTYSKIWQPRFHLEYTYSVDGRPFIGTRIDRVARDGRKHELTGTRRYPVGAAVRVRYDPQHPASALIETDVAWGAVTSAILSLAALVLAMVPASREPEFSTDDGELGGERGGERDGAALDDPVPSPVDDWSRIPVELVREDPPRTA